MPYESDAQRGYMHVHHPEIAARWDAEEHAKKKRRRDGVGKRMAYTPVVNKRSQPRYGDGGSHGLRVPEELNVFGKADDEDKRMERARSNRRKWGGAVLGAAAGHAATAGVGTAGALSTLKHNLPEYSQLKRGHRAALGAGVFAGHYHPKVIGRMAVHSPHMLIPAAVGAVGGAHIASRKKVEKADWMNIEEHKERAKRSRKTKRTGGLVASGSAAVGGLVLAKHPKAWDEASHIVRTARGHMPVRPIWDPNPGTGRVSRAVHEAKRYPGGAALLGAGAGTATGAGMYATGAINERRHTNAISRQRKARAQKVTASKREYVPEDARQRRLGMYTAGLLGAGAVLGYKGGKGIKEETKALRAIKVPPQETKRVPKGEKNPWRSLGSQKRFAVVTPRHGAMVGGSAASLAAAGGIQRHASKPRGRPWD